MIGVNASNRTDQPIYLDAETDLTDLPQYAEDNKLPIGTAAYVIETGKLYMMKSDYTFVEQ